MVLAEHQVQEPLALPSWSQVKPGAVFGDASARSLSSLGASVQALGLRLPLAGRSETGIFSCCSERWLPVGDRCLARLPRSCPLQLCRERCRWKGPGVKVASAR